MHNAAPHVSTQAPRDSAQAASSPPCPSSWQASASALLSATTWQLLPRPSQADAAGAAAHVTVTLSLAPQLSGPARKLMLTGPGPVQVFATPDGRFVYVANEGTRAAPGTTASVIDVAAGRVTATIETGRGAHGVVVCADGSRAFVTNLFDDTVAQVHAAVLSGRDVHENRDGGGATSSS